MKIMSLCSIPKMNTRSIKQQVAFKGGIEKANEWIKNNLKDVMVPENIIGSGYYNNVYSIPENDEYVIRARKSFDIHEVDLNKHYFGSVKDENLRINIGQPIVYAYFMDATRGNLGRIEFLKKQKGRPFGVPPYEALANKTTQELKSGEPDYDSKIRKETFEQDIQVISDFPLSAYEKLLEEMEQAAKDGYQFDYLNSNNLMIDENSQSFGFIDMEKTNCKTELGDLLYAVTNMGYYPEYETPSGYIVPSDRINKTIGNEMKIIDKFLTAMKNKGLKFNRDNTSMYFLRVLTSVPFSCYFRTFDESVKWQKLKEMGIA